VYFILIQLTESNQIFFINFSESDGEVENLGTIIQYLLFFLVPIFALYVRLFHRKRNAYYVEYLIFSFHIHTIWFVFLMVELFTVWLNDAFDQQWIATIASILSAPAQLATFIYLIVYLKRVFDQGWVKSIFKSFGVMTIYILTLAGFIAIYYFLILEN
jgi:hypothetical protein